MLILTIAHLRNGHIAPVDTQPLLHSLHVDTPHQPVSAVHAIIAYSKFMYLTVLSAPTTTTRSETIILALCSIRANTEIF